jgi:hypothetical protein
LLVFATNHQKKVVYQPLAPLLEGETFDPVTFLGGLRYNPNGHRRIMMHHQLGATNMPPNLIIYWGFHDFGLGHSFDHAASLAGIHRLILGRNTDSGNSDAGSNCVPDCGPSAASVVRALPPPNLRNILAP